jgi:ATP-binding cassette subfamily B multidrug efflux pump
LAFFAVLMVIGLIVSLIEVSILRFVGSIVDMLRATSPQRVLADHGASFLWMGGVILFARQ